LKTNVEITISYAKQGRVNVSKN